MLKALLQFFGTLIWRISTDNPTSDVPLSSLKVDMLSSLTQSVCQCLDVAGCPDYYDLPLLEKSLDCLLHLSARFVLIVLPLKKIYGSKCLLILFILREVQ